MKTEQTHSGALNRSKVLAKPESGTTQPSRKSNNCDSAITDAQVLRKASEKVTTVGEPVAEKYKSLECVKKQLGSNWAPLTSHLMDSEDPEGPKKWRALTKKS